MASETDRDMIVLMAKATTALTALQSLADMVAKLDTELADMRASHHQRITYVRTNSYEHMCALIGDAMKSINAVDQPEDDSYPEDD
jgi:hypothetical protein